MTQRPIQRVRSIRLRAAVAQVVIVGLLGGLTAMSAVLAKRYRPGPAMVALDSTGPVSLTLATPGTSFTLPPNVGQPIAPVEIVETRAEVQDEPTIVAEPSAALAEDVYTPPEGFERYFNGRPLRAVRTISMVVTAYSPDHRSCPGTDDGLTATNDSVWTNAMRLVAADTNLLPFGSLVSVPGYAGGEVVPVLDRGGAIKGRRLDVLYPTHEIARQWGRQKLQVTVWEYADERRSTRR